MKVYSAWDALSLRRVLTDNREELRGADELHANSEELVLVAFVPSWQVMHL
jgi:hypothetical protein